MKYEKPPLSLDEQINLLISRGMEIPDRARATRYLAHINYYRLRAYWLPFEKETGNGDHLFQPGTTFDSALDLYLFDRKFRLLIIEAIERIEVSFRSNFAHVLSMKYGSHAYLESHIFKSIKIHVQCMSGIDKEIGRSKETFIKHYNSRYREPEYPPIWAACEVMTFGLLSKWFDNLKHRQERQAIAQVYGLDEAVLTSFMHHITPVRNLAAHHSRLWNRRLTFAMTLPQRPTALSDSLNPQDNKKIYNTIVMLGYLLTVISPGTMWRRRVQQLIVESPRINPSAMGFPGGWNDLPFWKAAP